MLLNPQEGPYIFEVILGFGVEGGKQYNRPYLVQANDLEEAEEKVLEYLDELDLEQQFWIEEVSEPLDLGEYAQRMAEGEAEPLPLLGELTEEEFKDLPGY